MRSAMISPDRMVGWFPHTSREWIEFIIVALLLWLLMVVAISELELSAVS
jgi:nitrate reductase NapE component